MEAPAPGSTCQRRKPARSLEEVRGQLLSSVQALPSERRALLQSLGRVTTQSILSPMALPPMDNAAMDGYAVRADDVKRVPAELLVVGKVSPGQVFAGRVESGEAVRVFTGACLPAGTDAVVMQEVTESIVGSPERVRVLESVKPWQDIRFRGEDVAQGSLLLSAGTELGAGALGLLASCGLDEVEVVRTPRVGILVTGSELIPAGVPLQPGQIHESNSLLLASLLRSEGVDPVLFPTVPDHPEAVLAALEAAAPGLDLLMTSGGASVGEPDWVRDRLRHWRAQVWDGEVDLKPGKPFFWARRQGLLVMGLPGNPVSAFVTAVLLVLPVIRRLQGKSRELPIGTPGVLVDPLVNEDARRHFVRVIMDAGGEVRSAGIQASHRLRSLALANGLVDVPPRTTLPAGSSVSVIRWGNSMA